MPSYSFQCNKCNKEYSDLVAFDKTDVYPSVECPHCKSKKKTRLMSASAFAFSNPVDTGKWNNGATGHDYRFKHNIPKVKKQRQMAEVLSHMGSDPYGSTVEKDLKLGEGIHDPETRPGLV